MTVVTTKQELISASDRGDIEIIVRGDLAQKLRNTKTFTVIGIRVFAGLAVSAAALSLLTKPGREVGQVALKAVAEEPVETRRFLFPLLRH